MEKGLKKKYFKLIDKFINYHHQYRYPIIFNYSVLKVILKSLKSISDLATIEFKQNFTGLLLRGSHCRAYSSLNEDIDLIIVHNFDKKSDIFNLITFFENRIREKNLNLCDQGIEHFYKGAIYKTPEERKKIKDEFFKRDFDIKLLFTGLPVYNKFEIIKLRREFLLKAVNMEEERREWVYIYEYFKKPRNFMAKKAAIKLFSRISKIHDFDDNPFSFYEINSNLRYLIYEAEEKIRKCFEKRKTNYFPEPERELQRIEEFLKRKPLT
jgi:hypothetical protein